MTHGIELCDANLQAALSDGDEPRLIRVVGQGDTDRWPGYALNDGRNYLLGQLAEDAWFIHSRNVVHTFWSKLNHDATNLAVTPRPPSFSEIAYLFLKDFTQRLAKASPGADRMVLAVPGVYLKDADTEDEKIGLLLGMAADLKLPLSGIIDMATASLCDPRAPRFNPARPVVHIDLHLHAAEISLLGSNTRLERRALLNLPQFGVAELLKHLTSTMGNRFLRQTSFDVMEDGRIEQIFYNQTKALLTEGEPDFVYHLNTTKRGYEMHVKREILIGDSNAFVESLAQSLLKFIQAEGLSPALCVVALTERSGWLQQLEPRLRGAGFVRFIRLPPGAAAAGAANIGAVRMAVPKDIGDVPVVTSVPSELSSNRVAHHWEVHLQKARAAAAPRPRPTHAVIEGVGVPLIDRDPFKIGAQGLAASLPLPDSFNQATDCSVVLRHEGQQWWFTDPAPADNGQHPRIELGSGDRLVFQCGTHTAEVLFAHCSLTSEQTPH